MPLNKFEEISHSSFYNKEIRVKCLIVGKSFVPYHIPKDIIINCVSARKCNCKFKEKTKLTIIPGNELILLFIDINNANISLAVRQYFKIICGKIIVDVISRQDVERLFITQVGDEQSRNLGTRTVFFIGHGIEVNTKYILKGYTTTDPRDQTATHVFTHAKQLKTNIDSFAISKNFSDLNIFRFKYPKIDAVQAMFDFLENTLYESYARNITRINNRPLLHMTVDLVYRSVLRFVFSDDIVHKGWLDALILGDSRCGKGYVTQRMIDFFEEGEMCSAEGMSHAGLVGGLQQIQGHWVSSWGKIPLNDRGLLAIDEAGNLKKQWAELSRIRSEGRAEITKILMQEANARTRLIFICNGVRDIKHYSYGIQAIRDVIFASEDIARFDMALIVAKDDVPNEITNEVRPRVKFIYPKELERKLILWTWGLKQDDVIFTDKAIHATLKAAINISKEFDSDPPLIQGENVRIKIARIAVAIAARFYNASKDGTKLIVESVHVIAAFSYLHRIYELTTSGYFDLSKLRPSKNQQEKDLKTIISFLDSFVLDYGDICRCLLMNNIFTVNDIAEYTSQSKDTATELISVLLHNNGIVKRGASMYVKTPMLVDYLKKRVLKSSHSGG